MSQTDKKKSGGFCQDRYWKEWYEKNQKEFNRKRRKRYRDDPEYRQRCLDDKKQQRARKRREREAFKQQQVDSFVEYLRADGFTEEELEQATKSLPKGPAGLPRVHKVRGKPVLLYPIGFLAARMGRPRGQVRRWELGRVIPRPTLREQNGKRWFSLDYLEACAVAIKVANKYEDWSLDVFRDELRKAFNGIET